MRIVDYLNLIMPSYLPDYQQSALELLQSKDTYGKVMILSTPRHMGKTAFRDWENNMNDVLDYNFTLDKESLNTSENPASEVTNEYNLLIQARRQGKTRALNFNDSTGVWIK